MQTAISRTGNILSHKFMSEGVFSMQFCFSDNIVVNYNLYSSESSVRFIIMKRSKVSLFVSGDIPT